MISIARTFGAPVSVPAGNVARVASNASASPASVPVTVDSMCWTWLYFTTFMNSSTRTDPGSDTRRTSLRARSTNIVCSARSFPSASISPASRRSSTGLVPRGQVPAIGFETIRSPFTDTSVSGLAPTTVRSSWRRMYMYGEGFTSRRAAYSPSESASPRSSRLREITP